MTIKHTEGKWHTGEKKKLAEALGIAFPRLSDLLNRKVRCTPELAAHIEKVTGKQITRMDLLYRDESKNPLLN